MRVAMFVDCLSLWNGAKAYSVAKGLAAPARVDFKKLKDVIQGTRELSAARAYILDKPKTKPGTNSKDFTDALLRFGYETQTMPVSAFPAFREMLMGQLLKDAQDVDTIALVTQDGAVWRPALEALKATGLKVEVWQFEPFNPVLKLCPAATPRLLGPEVLQ